MSTPPDNPQDAQGRPSVGSRRALFEAAAASETLTPARGALSPRSLGHIRTSSQPPPLNGDAEHPVPPDVSMNSRRTPSVGTLSALAELRKKFENAPHSPEPEPLHPPDSLSQRSLSSTTSAGARYRGTASSIGSATDSSVSESFLSTSASGSPSPLSSANNSTASTPTTTPAVRKKAHRKRASTGNRDDHGEEITSVEAEAGVLLKIKAKLFVLQSVPSVQWVEAGSGVAEFRMDRRVDKVMLWMADKKTKKPVMWHPVHPQIELKSNANKSWVWTSQDLAHLDQEKPTVQTFAIRFKHSHLAKLFKTKYDQYRELNLIKEAQALEELKENRRKSLAMLGDEARASLHSSPSPAPAPALTVTIAVTPPSGADPTVLQPPASSTPPRSDPAQSSAPPSPHSLSSSSVKDRTGGSPMTAAAMEKYLQIASMSLPPHAHSYARKITGFTDFFLGDPTPEPPPSAPASVPPLRDLPSPRLSPVLSPSLLPQNGADPDGAFQLSSAAAAAALTPSSPTARSKRTGTIMRGGAKAARGRKPDKAAKIMRFFGANVPSEALELQPEQQYEPSNPMAKAFPRMKALRYMKQSSSNVHDPLPDGVNIAGVKSRINVLNRVHNLIGLDKYVTQTMIAQLREENALLQAMKDSANPHSITLCLPSADATTEGSPKVGSRDLSSEAAAAAPTTQTNASIVTMPMLYNSEGWSLDTLTELCDVNAFFHRQAASIALALENLKRSQQFRMPGAKHIPQRHDTSSNLRVHRPSVIQDMVNPNLFRAFTAFKDPPRDDESKVKVIRFEVTKINRIRKNTPRVLELDLATCSLTVLKNKNDEDSSGQCTHRECLITLDTIIGVELVDKNDRELGLSFYNNKSDDESSNSKKSWRLIFESPSSRERFFRLMQIHMLSASEASESGSSQSLASSSSGLAGLLRDRSEERKKGTSPSHSASALSTYLPQPLRFTQKIKSSARQLPIVRLARTLHECWSLQKLEEGWRYGSALDEVQLLHPHLVPFDQLKASQKAHFETIALQAAAAILTLGYAVQKRVDALDDEDEDDIYSGPGLGTISTDLVQLVEFLAENGHEAWAEQRISEGWVLGQENDAEKRTHPHLKPYNQLPSSAKETERNTAYKVIGSLLEWGYSIQKVAGGDSELSVS